MQNISRLSLDYIRLLRILLIVFVKEGEDKNKQNHNLKCQAIFFSKILSKTIKKSLYIINFFAKYQLISDFFFNSFMSVMLTICCY